MPWVTVKLDKQKASYDGGFEQVTKNVPRICAEAFKIEQHYVGLVACSVTGIGGIEVEVFTLPGRGDEKLQHLKTAVAEFLGETFGAQVKVSVYETIQDNWVNPSWAT